MLYIYDFLVLLITGFSPSDIDRFRSHAGINIKIWYWRSIFIMEINKLSIHLNFESMTITNEYLTYKAGILRDKTMDDKLIYIPNDDKQDKLQGD